MFAETREFNFLLFSKHFGQDRKEVRDGDIKPTAKPPLDRSAYFSDVLSMFVNVLLSMFQMIGLSKAVTKLRINNATPMAFAGFEPTTSKLKKRGERRAV